MGHYNRHKKKKKEEPLSPLDKFVHEKTREHIEELNNEMDSHFERIWQLCKDSDISDEDRQRYIKIHEDRIDEIMYKLDDVDYIIHYMQKVSYEYRKSLPKRDNDFTDERLKYTLYTPSKLRTPKLKRKGAWKRFYKTFPSLKGKDSFAGKKLKNLKK